MTDAKGVDVLHELAEAEDHAVEADAGLEGLEPRGGGRGYWRPRGEREARDIARDLEQLVDCHGGLVRPQGGRGSPGEARAWRRWPCESEGRRRRPWRCGRWGRSNRCRSGRSNLIAFIQ
jgi:hypothetical protein